ncbi:hypothetical protein FGO68_gene7268 [Halteria grandinella]|uniref:Uncharacterized protein n=1 Tax=Halteria grandinella TaxID=5974 RepID=A0A8J8NM52_HALGN|nr:hypothetical protein FGO68_gene7268 [Halteria grandinella]
MDAFIGKLETIKRIRTQGPIERLIKQVVFSLFALFTILYLIQESKKGMFKLKRAQNKYQRILMLTSFLGFLIFISIQLFKPPLQCSPHPEPTQLPHETLAITGKPGKFHFALIVSILVKNSIIGILISLPLKILSQRYYMFYKLI